jgi:hypothetical protein
MPIVSRHPTQSLRFLITDFETPITRETVLQCVEALSRKRNWLLGPPRLLEGAPHPEGLGPEEGLMGVEILIYSAIPPWKDKLSRDVDEVNFQEACDLVDVVADFSNTNACNMDFYLDDVLVGQINRGKPDKLLTECLLGEWRRNLYPWEPG